MNKKIILTTTATFSKTVEGTGLKDSASKGGVEVVLHTKFEEPFPFNAENVFGITAGHTPDGELMHVGPKEAALFPNLKVVTPFGVGMDHIDEKGLTDMGIEVKTLPHFSKRTVAELTFSFIFALARRIVPQTIDIRGGTWERQNGANIEDKTLGIIGLGNIGKEVAKIGKGLGMHVIANDLVYDDDFMKEWEVEKGEKEKIISESDFLTLHVPLTPETENLIDDKALKSMKKGAFFVNAARGEVVDEKALLSALQSDELAGAAIDVFSVEPPFENKVLSALIKHPNVIATPHVGAFTPETRYAIAAYILDQVMSLKPTS